MSFFSSIQENFKCILNEITPYHYFQKCIIPNDDSFLRLIINKNSFPNEKTLYFLAFLYENARDFCEHSLVVQQFKIAVTYCLNSQLVVLITDKLNQNCVGLS